MSNMNLRLPHDLQQRMKLQPLGPCSVPGLLVQAEGTRDTPAPMVVWLHGRTARKELDPGRYLRLMRAGISVCALDLPGHGDRFDAELQHHDHILDVIRQMADELDGAVQDAITQLGADGTRLGIGGMSAGGMVIALRLTRPHPYSCCVLEATSGSWGHQLSRPMFASRTSESVQAFDPINHLQQWRPIPVLAVHCRADEWVDWKGQDQFLSALKQLDEHPERIETLLFDHTGSEHEHVGFGDQSSVVKDRERDFFAQHLFPDVS